MKREARIALAAIVASGVVTAAACFPDVTFKSETGGSGAGAAEATSSSSGTTGTGGHTSTSSSSSSSTTSSASSAASSTGSTGDAGCTIDDDGDKVLSWKCAQTDPTKDCADEDPRAFPGADFQASAITGAVKPGTQSFDFDCNGTVTQETPVLPCGLGCNTATVGFNAAVPCGMSGTLGKCGVLCAPWAALTPTQTKVQRCK